ncbi:MAG: CBS domain-containing protein [Nanoarchaeota archaeon]|nr:CBS domain-containing protein [Nanoarchaeota archaeon]MBU4299891.1 CBS domain-containing protein [Nanoarchaeota archaeon]MBU4452330.1 CBS domain-containing protein [Nanoarchaeota archaeon]MCG2724546.1 CBS domain-containing protein [archaeon]
MPGILENSIKTVMKTNTLMLKKEDTISEAVELMQKTGIQFITVVDDFKTLIGTLCPRDILKAFQVSSILGGNIKISEEFFVSGLSRKIEEVMMAPAIQLEEENTVGDALRLFTNNQVTFIPVINKGTVVIGFVSLLDVFGQTGK